MTREEAQSCIKTIELLRRLAYNIHGVMDVIDARNCEKIIEALQREIDHTADTGKKASISCAHENDVIPRKAAIDAIEKIAVNERDTDRGFLIFCGLSAAITVIDDLPSSQPQIIRCKDCKHRDKYGCCKYWKGLAMGDIPIATDDYDFCSYAKRI